MDMLLRKYEQKFQWARHGSLTRKKLLTVKLNCEQKKRTIKSSLECSTVCVKNCWKHLRCGHGWRMLKISWTEKVINEEGLVHDNEGRSTLKTISCRKHRRLGHVLRHDNLLHDIIEGKMLGKATRGSKRMELLHDGRERFNLNRSR